MANKWTEAEIKRLKELTEADYTDKEIADIISNEFNNERTKKAVESKRLDEGFKKNNNKNTHDETTDADKEINDKEVNVDKKRITKEQKDVFNIEQLQQMEIEDDWTRENILALNYLLSRGLSNNRISQLIGKTKTEILHKINELKQKLSS